MQSAQDQGELVDVALFFYRFALMTVGLTLFISIIGAIVYVFFTRVVILESHEDKE